MMVYSLAYDSQITETEYLQGELISDIKHEYIDGEVYAMAEASRNHLRLVGNLHTALNRHLNNSPCEPFVNYLKVKANRNFFYPDVMVICDDPQGNDYYTEQPVLIVEVLSKATRRLDKTVKFNAYKALPSLQEYVLIEQDYVEIQVFRRVENWTPAHYFLGDDMRLASVDLTIPVSEIYHRVNNEDMQDYLQQLQQAS